MTDQPVAGVALRTIDANNIRMRYAEAGSGPLVLFCHGWPESWYSWRHQLQAVSAAGFRCIAPDMRGYGSTDAPEGSDQYTLFHLVGDMAELVRALGEGIRARYEVTQAKLAEGLATSPRSVVSRLGEMRFYKRFLDEVEAIAALDHIGAVATVDHIVTGAAGFIGHALTRALMHCHPRQKG